MTALVTNPMASSDQSPVRYHVNGPQGDQIQLIETYGVTIAGVSFTYLMITNGSDKIILSKTNAADLATGLSNFGTNGVLS
jgi:hypothetical protein